MFIDNENIESNANPILWCIPTFRQLQIKGKDTIVLIEYYNVIM